MYTVSAVTTAATTVVPIPESVSSSRDISNNTALAVSIADISRFLTERGLMSFLYEFLMRSAIISTAVELAVLPPPLRPYRQKQQPIRRHRQNSPTEYAS
jgi:hypothetical protein